MFQLLPLHLVTRQHPIHKVLDQYSVQGDIPDALFAQVLSVFPAVPWPLPPIHRRSSANACMVPPSIAAPAAYQVAILCPAATLSTWLLRKMLETINAGRSLQVHGILQVL